MKNLDKMYSLLAKRIVLTGLLTLWLGIVDNKIVWDPATAMIGIMQHFQQCLLLFWRSPLHFLHAVVCSMWVKHRW